MTEIRSLRKDDKLDDLIALSREFFDEYESHHEDFFKLDSLSDRNIVDYFSQWIDNDDGETLIALTEGRIVGYMTVHVRTQPSYWKIKKVGVISGLMVQETHRRRGIARRLLVKARAFFEKKALMHFTVNTAVGNRGAIEFYERNGLVPLSTAMMGEVGNAPAGQRAFKGFDRA